MRLANRIIGNQDDWHYDHCKVDLSRLKTQSLASVIKPHLERLSDGQVIQAWCKAASTTHSAAVDGLAEDPVRYCIQVFKNEMEKR